MEPTNRAKRLKVGMVGGAAGAGIAGVHRKAMGLDGSFEIPAGMFSRNADRSRRAGRNLEIAGDRIYAGFKEMAQTEAGRADGIDAVVIVTPNDSHFPIADEFVQAGINVICEKPLATNMDDALRIYRSVAERAVVFGLTHNYSGYTMVRYAAALVQAGYLGDIRVVQAEHAQGSGALPTEPCEDGSLPWRSDPDIGGPEIVVADIGTHAHHLVRFVTGLEVTEVSAELSTHVPERSVYDNAHVNLRFSNGARGALWASRVAAGNEHGLHIRLYGDKAGMEWRHEDPEHLFFRPVSGPAQCMAKGQPDLPLAAEPAGRLKLGHPEGFIERFAALYGDFAGAVRARLNGEVPDPSNHRFPTVSDGVWGVKFVEAAVRSHNQNGTWTDASVVLA